MRIVLALVFFSTTVCGLHICGNFCGPTWCNGTDVAECVQTDGSSCVPSPNNCNEQGDADGSCADDCCKTHDGCCGSDDRSGCNDDLIHCLNQCDGSGPSCYYHGVPVSPSIIKDAMKLNPEQCCGTRCDAIGKVES